MYNNIRRKAKLRGYTIGAIDAITGKVGGSVAVKLGKAGKRSIAAGQYRICLDFQIHPVTEEKKKLNGENVVTTRMLNSTSKVQIELDV